MLIKLFNPIPSKMLNAKAQKRKDSSEKRKAQTKTEAVSRHLRHSSVLCMRFRLISNGQKITEYSEKKYTTDRILRTDGCGEDQRTHGKEKRQRRRGTHDLGRKPENLLTGLSFHPSQHLKREPRNATSWHHVNIRFF